MYRFRNTSAGHAGPLTLASFAPLMTACGPFEAAPHLAIGVSGGADSLALALLAHEWARNKAGAATALIVDHGLRPDAAAEAAQTAAWLTARGIASQILHWKGPPQGNLQQAARQARYRLLTEWCRARGVLHLLVAHHRDDQAETMLLRLARGSGVDGLSAMAPVSLRDGVRLVRPLLGVSGRETRAFLSELGQPWIDDPSNQNPEFDRVRMRRAGSDLSRLGLTPARLADAAADQARARRALDTATAALLARTVRLDPLGYARIDPAPLAAAPEELALRALRQLILTLGNAEFPPREDRLATLWAAIGRGLPQGRTLGGCQFAAASGGRIVVLREARRIAASVPVSAGERLCWDGRFRLIAPATGEIRPLPAGIGRTPDTPNRVLPTLPSFWQQGELRHFPEQLAGGALEIAFQPCRPLTA